MSYIKISDASIMDLAGMQQIINVVNQHSDYINALINRFGILESPDWDQPSSSFVYDPATSIIAYGKETITTDNEDAAPNGIPFYKIDDIDYNGAVFSSPPHIILTHDNSTGTAKTQLDFTLSVYNVTTSGFTMRAVRGGEFGDQNSEFGGKFTIDNDIRVNWLAIGPR